MGLQILFRVTLILCLLSVGACADTTNADWTFSAAGNDLGWKANSGTPPPWMNVHVESGYWAGDTTSAWNFGIISPDLAPANLVLGCSQYIQIKARVRNTDGTPFQQDLGAIYWNRVGSDSYSSERIVRFQCFGDDQWHIYNVLVGDHPLWNTTLSRLMIAPCVRKNTHIEIAWIRLMSSTTQADFSVDKSAYPAGAVISNTTPGLKVINFPIEIPSSNTARDPFTPNRAEFYWRPGSSTSDGDWVLDGVDNNAFDGLEHTYSPFPDGTYDLGVRVITNACVASDWHDSLERWVDNLTIKKDVRPRVNLDAATSLGALPRDLLGYNVLWPYLSQIYDPVTRSLPPLVESAVNDLGVGLLRYPGGCFADTFYWKQSIGPLASRPPMFTNDCESLTGASAVAKFGLDEFLQYCEARNIEPLLTLRFRWPDAPPGPMDPPSSAAACAAAVSDAEDLVEYCNSPTDGSNPNGGTDWALVRAANGHPMPYHVRLFEIANEPFGGDPFGGNAPPNPRDPFIASMTEYVSKMRAVDPSIKVSVYAYLDGQMRLTDTARQGLQYIFRQMPTSLDRTQAHLYLPFSATQTNLTQLYLETMAAGQTADERIKGVRDLLNLTLPETGANYKLRISEWNNIYGWENNPALGWINYDKSRTLMSAISAAEIQRVFVDNRSFVESSALFPLLEGMGQGVISGSPLSCFNVTPVSDVILRNPLYYVMQIFGTRLGETLASTTVVGSPTFDFFADSLSMLETTRSIPALTAIGGKDSSGAIYLMVINKDMSNAQPAVVNLNNVTGNPGQQYTADVWTLNSSSPWNYNDLLNTQRVKVTKSSETFVSGSEYSFPAHSVTSFIFHPGAVNQSYTSIGSLRILPDGAEVEIDDRVVTAVFPGSNSFYMQNPDRSAAMKVVWNGILPIEYARVQVHGTMETAENGERYIQADTVTASMPTGAVEPILFQGQALLLPCIETRGLLVSMGGRVSGATSGSFFLEDYGLGSLRVKVYAALPPQNGSFVKVTGIRTTEEGGPNGKGDVIMTRRAADITPL